MPCERWLSGIKMLEKCKVFLKSVQISFGYRENSPCNDKNTNGFRRRAMSVHSTDAFRHAAELVGIEIWGFCQHAQFYFAQRRGLS